MNCDEFKPLACCDSPFLEVFAGFTTATTNGNTGGRAGLHLMCATEFSGSHACHASEYERTKNTTTPPAGGAWVDYSAAVKKGNSGITATADCSAADYGRYTDFQNYTNCGNWTSAYASHLGVAIIPEEITGSGQNCDEFKPVACCE